MSIQMSGYLPPDHGLEPLEQQLVERFENAYTAGDSEPVSVVVVGVVDVAGVKHRADPERHPPVVSLRLAALEVAQGARADQLRAVLAALMSNRHGDVALDGMDEALAELLTAGQDLDRPTETSNETGTSTASRSPATGRLANPFTPPSAPESAPESGGGEEEWGTDGDGFYDAAAGPRRDEDDEPGPDDA